jgi:hypothetical protein
MLLDPDPHSQYGCGSRTAKSMGIHADPDPQHWAEVKTLIRSVILALTRCHTTYRYSSTAINEAFTARIPESDYVLSGSRREESSQNLS